LAKRCNRGRLSLTSLNGHVALVTGASRGIGRAIAIALSHQDVKLCLVGRDPIALATTTAVVRESCDVADFQIDLTAEQNLDPLIQHLETHHRRLDILIHGAGVFHQDPMDQARIEDLDLQYAVNVRAPYVLTQRLLPLLAQSHGQVVFINSSAGLVAKRPEIGQYSATKHALRAIADSLREEVNSKGIRVLSVYLGRTATPMQEAVHQQEGKVYHPETLLQPEDIAAVVLQALMLPPTAEVTDISMRPMRKQ
jgi:NADP-dependent 3-hydroxy acid dehydrogenase YdfG